MSPRLIIVDEGTVARAPLLPEPRSPDEEQDRFCTDGPVLETPGMPARRASVLTDAALPFPALVHRMESAVGQGSLLLNERLRTLHLRAQRRKFSKDQIGDLCDIADGVAAAAYHLQKWAALLAPEDGHRTPTKPSACEDKEEAFASMHFSSPRIIVAAAGAHKGLAKNVKEHGDQAEATLNRKGVRTEDIRALAPHLETLIFRLSRLSCRLQNREKISDFIPAYFAPALGIKLSRRIVTYLDGRAEI